MQSFMRRDKMKKSLTTVSSPVAPNILAIEASANQLSIAVMIDSEVVAERQHPAVHGHAAGIVPLTIETLKDAGMTFDAMTHVAAGCGPGSFTGIRVGLAAAKGFCMAHKATGVGVSGLQALAHAATNVVSGANAPFLVLADTRRGPLYAQIFDATAQPVDVIFEASIKQFPQLIDAKITGSDMHVVGTYRAAVADVLTMAGITVVLPDVNEMPSASMVACLANEKIIKNQIGPLHPLYLADPRLGPKKKSG
jgi:tRNA threonylcarbamoyladenosine biosynthesis protein TsaB